jgi:hypothetical protein
MNLVLYMDQYKVLVCLYCFAIPMLDYEDLQYYLHSRAYSNLVLVYLLSFRHV